MNQITESNFGLVNETGDFQIVIAATRFFVPPGTEEE